MSAKDPATAGARRAGGPPRPNDAVDETPTARDGADEPAGDAQAADEPERVAAAEPAPEQAAEGDSTPEPDAEDPLTRAQRERDEYLDLARRAQADFENYRKRAAREAAAAGDRAKGNLVRELLPIVDNLERALGSAADSEQHLADGVRLVHEDLIAVLERNGVQQFDPSGEPFDPTLHEALSTRVDEGAKAGVVLDVVEKGYTASGGGVLRPARVVVSG